MSLNGFLSNIDWERKSFPKKLKPLIIRIFDKNNQNVDVIVGYFLEETPETQIDLIAEILENLKEKKNKKTLEKIIPGGFGCKNVLFYKGHHPKGSFFQVKIFLNQVISYGLTGGGHSRKDRGLLLEVLDYNKGFPLMEKLIPIFGNFEKDLSIWPESKWNHYGLNCIELSSVFS